MKPTIKLTTVKRALAVAAILAVTGTAYAKKPASVGPGVSGDLSPDRTSVVVNVTAPACTAGVDPISLQPTGGTLSVYIFQSVGRLINIGTSNTAVVCTGASTSQDVTVNAVSGLTFQPGPATLLVRFSFTDLNASTPTVTETGSRIDLH